MLFMNWQQHPFFLSKLFSCLIVEVCEVLPLNNEMELIELL
jgi:hypothetical protein